MNYKVQHTDNPHVSSRFFFLVGLAISLNLEVCQKYLHNSILMKMSKPVTNRMFYGKEKEGTY